MLVRRSLGAAVRVAGAVPPAGLVFLSIVSVQIGAAFAKGLFPALGAQGAVFLRLAFAAVLLLALWRPRARGHSRAGYLSVLLFGAVIALMNSTFYAALERVPLGIVVTVEFLGPISVALFGSRRLLDVLWAILALLGLVLLTPIAGVSIDPLGVGLGLVAGACWAAYIFLSARVGRAFPGGTGLALSMLVGALATAPIGVWQAGERLLDANMLLVGFAVALLSSVIPYSLELEALRRLPAPVFGVLLSMEPAVATLAGFVMLGESLGPVELAAIGLLVIASAGATYFGASSRHQ